MPENVIVVAGILIHGIRGVESGARDSGPVRDFLLCTVAAPGG